MDVISQIKSKLDIVDILGSYISLKKSGRNYKANCPFHGEKTPSFMVSQELQIYKCFGCGVTGDVIKFVQDMEGIDFVQAMEQLAEKAGIEIEKKDYDKNSLKKKTLYEINEAATLFYRKLLRHQLGKEALKYLTDTRKLTKQTIDHFEIGYAPNEWDALFKYLTKQNYQVDELITSGLIIKKNNGTGYIDKFRNRIIFPFVDITGKIIGFTGRALDNTEPKYLNSPETPIFHKSSYLYALDKAKVSIKTQGVIFVEGQLDVISSHQAAITNVVASSGTSITAEQLQLLKRYTNDLILCLDTDNAGIKAVYRAIELAERQEFNIKVVMIPEGFKDIDELVKKDTVLATKTLQNPIPIYDFFIAESLQRFDKNTATGKKNIINNLQPLLGKLNNKVMLESYIKELSKELDIEVKTIESIIKQNININEKDLEISKKEEKDIKNNLERYYLGMLIKSEIDVIKAYLYNFDPEGWEDKEVIRLLEKLKHFITEEKTFKIEKYLELLDEKDQIYIKDLYLQEIISSTKELEDTKTRINKRDNKEKIADLIEELKIAEKQNNIIKVQEILQKIENIKKTLL